MKKFLTLLGVVSLMLMLLSGCTDMFNELKDSGSKKSSRVPQANEEVQEGDLTPTKKFDDSDNVIDEAGDSASTGGSSVEGDSSESKLPPMDDGDYHDVTDSNGAYKIGSAIKTNNLRIAYLDCETGWVDDDDYYGPSVGNRIVRAYFRLENNGSEAVTCGSFDFAVYADNVKCKDFYNSDVDTLPSYTTLSAGRIMEGWAYYEVPEDAQRIELEFSGDNFLGASEGFPIFVIE